jgi:hypothetical protein
MFVISGMPQGPELDLLVPVIAARHTPNTWASYSSTCGPYVRFCVNEGLAFLPATQGVGLQWALHLAKRGTVQADTSGPYFASVNTIHDILGWSKPCTGALFDSFKRGWVWSQIVTEEDEADCTVLACPAAIARVWYRMHCHGPTLRNMLFCVLAFLLFLRPATILSITQAEVLRLGDRWTLQYKPLSWKTGLDSAGVLPVRSLDLSDLPLLRVGLQLFLQGVPKTWCMWGGSGRGVTTGVAAAWFSAVLLASVTPSVLGQLALYSCRRGGASAAMDVIEVAGGWAMASTALRRHYIDLSVSCDASALFWLGGHAGGCPDVRHQLFPVSGGVGACGLTCRSLVLAEGGRWNCDPAISSRVSFVWASVLSV